MHICSFDYSGVYFPLTDLVAMTYFSSTGGKSSFRIRPKWGNNYNEIKVGYHQLT